MSDRGRDRDCPQETVILGIGGGGKIVEIELSDRAAQRGAQLQDSNA